MYIISRILPTSQSFDLQPCSSLPVTYGVYGYLYAVTSIPEDGTGLGIEAPISRSVSSTAQRSAAVASSAVDDLTVLNGELVHGGRAGERVPGKAVRD